MTYIKEKQFDEERALYGSKDIIVDNCKFDGPADGESAYGIQMTQESLIQNYTELRHLGNAQM